MSSEAKLTHEAKEAIRKYLLLIFALPATILMAISFLVGFFIKDVAHTKANADVSQRVSEISQAALVKVHSLTEEIYKDQANFAQKIADKRSEARQTLESISKLNEEVKILKTAVGIIDSIKNAQNLTNEVTTYLANDKEFQSLIAEKTALILQPEISSITPKIHFQEWNLESRETGEATEWSPLPTDARIDINTSDSTLLIMANISRVQHKEPKINTEYRILIDGVEVSRKNTGDHYGYGYRNLSVSGVSDVSEGLHNIRLEYKTMSGIEYWGDSIRGQQQRQIIVIEVPKVKQGS